MLFGDVAAIADLWLVLVTVAVMWLAQQGNVWLRTVLHVGEEGLPVEGRVLDVMLESFAALVRILDVTGRKSFRFSLLGFSTLSPRGLCATRGLLSMWFLHTHWKHLNVDVHKVYVNSFLLYRISQFLLMSWLKFISCYQSNPLRLRLDFWRGGWILMIIRSWLLLWLQLSDGIGVTKDPVWMMILNVKFENRDGPTPGTSTKSAGCRWEKGRQLRVHTSWHHSCAFSPFPKSFASKPLLIQTKISQCVERCCSASLIIFMI